MGERFLSRVLVVLEYHLAIPAPVSAVPPSGPRVPVPTGRAHPQPLGGPLAEVHAELLAHRPGLGIGPQGLQLPELPSVIGETEGVEILVVQQEVCVSRPLLGESVRVDVYASDVRGGHSVLLPDAPPVPADGMEPGGVPPEKAQGDGRELLYREMGDSGDAPHLGDHTEPPDLQIHGTDSWRRPSTLVMGHANPSSTE